MNDPVINIHPLGFPWRTQDPFLFCVHHLDIYPAANAGLGPAASLAGRRLGQDFDGRDGWNMYHGETVPGFPQHPHRGFETVTIVRRGLVDHTDSLGAAARYGGGDVQWLTAGAGINHAEMFPLLDREGPNTLELFQIWLNLPARSKFARPYFTMFWNSDVPRHEIADSAGRTTEITTIAGSLGGDIPAPPPESWASHEGSDIAIWTIRMEGGARWTLPAAASAQTNRTLNVFEGSATIGGHETRARNGADLRGDADVEVVAGPEGCQMLLLQGRPIGEPVAQYGPFVMNSQEEVQQAFADYRRTQFGGWPWPDNAPVHARDEGRFARHADGKVERP